MAAPASRALGSLSPKPTRTTRFKASRAPGVSCGNSLTKGSTTNYPIEKDNHLNQTSYDFGFKVQNVNFPGPGCITKANFKRKDQLTTHFEDFWALAIQKKWSWNKNHKIHLAKDWKGGCSARLCFKGLLLDEGGDGTCQWKMKRCHAELRNNPTQEFEFENTISNHLKPSQSK